MKTYTIMEVIPAHRNEAGGWVREQRLRHKITEEGALLIWAAYYKLYGSCQTMETREKRGGIAYVSEIEYWQGEGALPKEFDWKQYLAPAES